MNNLEPLEFDECVVDSPAFRSNLHVHEKRLQNTSENIKKIIKEVKELTSAAKGIFHLICRFFIFAINSLILNISKEIKRPIPKTVPELLMNN